MLGLGLGGLSLGELAKRSVKQFLDDDMVTYAAALAYRVLFALFPFVIFLLALLGLLGLRNFFNWLIEQASTALPSNASGLVEQVIGQVRGGSSGGLLSFGILLAVWSASTGFRALMKALNAAYDVEEDRPAWKRIPLSILYTVGLAVLLIAAAGLMVVGPEAAQWLAGEIDLGDVVVTVWDWLRWPVAALLVAVVLGIVYYVAPNVDQPFQLVTAGSLLAVAAWIVASLGFSYYVANFGNYSATYGSLGGVIVLLLYFFISAATVLLGAEVNAVIYHARNEHRVAPPDARARR